MEIYALHGDDESFWDILIDFDLAEVRLPDACYACAFCRDHLGDKAGLYENREELWIQHSFNPLAEWSEKYLKEGCYLCLYGMKSGATWAKIENDKNPRDYLLQAIPILVDCALQ